ncbi:hypothetical protein P3L10_016957 [Capsicum annuum]
MRQVDIMVLHMMSTVRKMMINHEMVEATVTYLMSPNDGCGIERIMEHSPEISKKRRTSRTV